LVKRIRVKPATGCGGTLNKGLMKNETVKFKRSPTAIDKFKVAFKIQGKIEYEIYSKILDFSQHFQSYLIA
jgi:hypothetical protein